MALGYLQILQFAISYWGYNQLLVFKIHLPWYCIVLYYIQYTLRSVHQILCTFRNITIKLDIKQLSCYYIIYYYIILYYMLDYFIIVHYIALSLIILYLFIL